MNLYTTFVDWLADPASDPAGLARYVSWNTAGELVRLARLHGKMFQLANRARALADTFPDLDAPVTNGRTWSFYDRVQFARLLWLLANPADAPGASQEPTNAPGSELDSFTRAEVVSRFDDLMKRHPEVAFSVKSYVKSQAKVLADPFDQFMDRHRLVTSQCTFVRITRQITRYGQPVTLSRFHQPPFTQVGDPNVLFTQLQLTELVALANAQIQAPEAEQLDLGLPSQPKNVLQFPDSRKPRILFQPRNKTTRVGGSANFYANVDGEQPLTLQWWFKSDIDGSRYPINNQTRNTLWLSDVGFADAGSYYVMVTNEHGVVTSEEVRLTVMSSLAPMTGEELAGAHARTAGVGYRPGEGWRSQGYGSGYTYTTYAKTTPSMTCISDDLQVSTIPAPPVVVARGKPMTQDAAAEALANIREWDGMEI